MGGKVIFKLRVAVLISFSLPSLGELSSISHISKAICLRFEFEWFSDCAHIKAFTTKLESPLWAWPHTQHTHKLFLGGTRKVCHV